MYPGSFEFDALKKRIVKTVKQANNKLGDNRQDSIGGDLRKSLATAAKTAVHGNRARSTIGI